MHADLGMSDAQHAARWTLPFEHTLARREECITQLLGSVDGCGPWIAAHRCWIPAKTDSTTAAAQSAGQPAATHTHTSLQQCKHAGRIPKQPTACGPEQRCQALLKGVAKRPQTEAGPCSPCRRRSSGRLSTGSPSCSPTPPGCSQICHRRRQCCMSGRSSTHTCPAGEGCQGQQAGRRACKVISLHARQQHSEGLCYGMRPPAGLRSALLCCQSCSVVPWPEDWQLPSNSATVLVQGAFWLP